MTWGLRGFAGAIEKISLKSLEFHTKRGDFEKWAEESLHDTVLTSELKKANLAKLEGEDLRKALLKVLRRRLENLSSEIQSATRYF
jgi:hypothetical protein